MGFYEDHINAVAKHQAEQMKAGKSADAIRKYLAQIGWDQNEVNTIMRIAERMTTDAE